MTKFHAHTATEKANLEHGPTPSRAVNLYQYGARAVKRMSHDQRHIPIQNNYLVASVAGSHLKPGPWLHILQLHAPFNLRLNNVAVYLMAEVGMWSEQTGIIQQKGLWSLDARRKCWLQLDRLYYRFFGVHPEEQHWMR